MSKYTEALDDLEKKRCANCGGDGLERVIAYGPYFESHYVKCKTCNGSGMTKGE